MNRIFWIRILLMTLAFHGTALFFTFKRTYDAYVHIFFADHYRRAWFDHWEPRWYTGFPINSYPPGTHQLTALLSKFVGLQNAFIAIQMTSVLLIVVGVYRFSRLWVSPRAAEMAAIATVFSTSICETVHVFGQLPTTFSLGILLNGLVYGESWLRTANVRHLLVALAMGAATTAGHHVTTLFGGVFFVAPVVVKVLVDQLAKPEGRSRRAVGFFLLRTLLYGVGLISLLVVVVFPYWVWSISDPITQVPIPHASRDSFFENLNAGLVFWLIPHGLTLLVLPHVVRRTTSRVWPLCASYWTLFILGTGGTTGLPRFLLRGAFDILTLDRFTIWASIIVLPLVGEALTSQKKSSGKLILPALGFCAVILSVFTINLTQFRTFQPKHIDIQPIVDFLERDGHDNWRYLALGFGDQMAWLSANTTATTVDGNYHSARRLPELTTTSIERLEGAKYRGEDGLRSLNRFLSHPQKYNLKFVFSNDEFYDPLLHFSGFQRMARLNNGVVLWEKPDVPMLVRETRRKEIPLYQRLMWGLLPLASLACAVAAIWHWGGIQLPSKEVVEESPDLIYPAVVLLVLFLGGIVHFHDARTNPEAVVEKYLKHLDFRREQEAWELLHSLERPGREDFTLKRSVKNGLLASYAKLESVEMVTVSQGEDSSKIEARLRFLTPLGIRFENREFQLKRDDSAWRIVYRQLNQDAPEKRLWKSTAVSWQSRGRKEAGSAPTEFDDIMDRPDFRLIQAHAEKFGDTVAVFGELESLDSDPAALTITAKLYSDGELVGSRNHRIGAHLLAPGEWTPFRIDFEETELDIDRVQLICQSVVSTATQTPSLQLTQDEGKLSLRNLGIREATIPVIVKVTRDQGGKMKRVDHVMISEAVRPGRTLELPQFEQAAQEQAHTLAIQTYPPVEPGFANSGRDWKVLSFARTADLD